MTCTSAPAGLSIHSSCNASWTACPFSGFVQRHRKTEGSESSCFLSPQGHHHCYGSKKVELLQHGWDNCRAASLLSFPASPERATCGAFRGPLWGHRSPFLCSASPTPLPVSPGSISIVIHWHAHSHLGICFWRT